MVQSRPKYFVKLLMVTSQFVLNASMMPTITLLVVVLIFIQDKEKTLVSDKVSKRSNAGPATFGFRIG
jgi:hypothetical protein